MQHGDEHEDGDGREEEGRRPHLVAHALDRLHRHRDHHRPVGPVIALERHRDQARRSRQQVGHGTVARLDGLARQRVDPGGRLPLRGGRDHDGAPGFDPGEGQPAHGRDHALEVGQQVVELGGGGQAFALRELRGHAERGRARGLDRLVLHRGHDDAPLHVGRSAHDQGRAERPHDEQACAQGQAGAARSVGPGVHGRAGRGARASYDRATRARGQSARRRAGGRGAAVWRPCLPGAAPDRGFTRRNCMRGQPLAHLPPARPRVARALECWVGDQGGHR